MVYIYMYVYICMYIYVCIWYIYIYHMYVCIYMYVYIYMYVDVCVRVCERDTMEYYSAIERTKTASFAETWMDPEMSHNNEVRPKEKHKDCIILLIFGI